MKKSIPLLNRITSSIYAEFIEALAGLAPHHRSLTCFYLTIARPYVFCHKAQSVEVSYYFFLKYTHRSLYI